MIAIEQSRITFKFMKYIKFTIQIGSTFHKSKYYRKVHYGKRNFKKNALTSEFPVRWLFKNVKQLPGKNLFFKICRGKKSSSSNVLIYYALITNNKPLKKTFDFIFTFSFSVKFVNNFFMKASLNSRGKNVSGAKKIA